MSPPIISSIFYNCKKTYWDRVKLGQHSAEGRGKYIHSGLWKLAGAVHVPARTMFKAIKAGTCTYLYKRVSPPRICNCVVYNSYMIELTVLTSCYWVFLDLLCVTGLKINLINCFMC